MPNLSSILKSEISRLSRREIKSSITPIHASNVALKKAIANLKRRLAALEADSKRLSSIRKPEERLPALDPEEAGKARITAKNIKALRNKLGLSQGAFGKLIGVSRQNVFAMEHKEGRMKVRTKTLASILAARGMGKREARKRLEAMENNA